MYDFDVVIPEYKINIPERSNWYCELTNDTIYRPIKGHEPNRFHRFMQKLILGFNWKMDGCND